MSIINDKNLINKKDYLFDDYFEKMDLNEDIKKIYEIINDDEVQDDFEKTVALNKLRNENHKRYYSIDINKYTWLSENFSDVVNDVVMLYNCLDPKNMLDDTEDNAINNKKILNNIERRIKRLDRMVETTLKELTIENDKKQSKFSIAYFNNLDINNDLRKELIEKYNELVLYNSVIVDDSYEDLKNQMIRNDYIKSILEALNIHEETKINIQKQDKLKILNSKIDQEILKYKDKINYLEDLMPVNSKHKDEFNNFKEFYNKIVAYDDTNYNNAKQTFEILSDDNRFKILISNFEELFITDIENNKKEEIFVYEKFGIKNIKSSLNYITANYIDKLDEENKNIIEYIYKKIESTNYDLDELNKALRLIVRNIWADTITKVYSYDPNKDFYFVCSNNRFIDEKYQTILITKKELERVDQYEDYQIGFICGYNDNILYITENDDIMTVDFDDMSNLKTPIQLEQEFINFKVCNRIALNGYKTKIDAVYYINNGTKEVYRKALELANMYKIPLIELKKDN